MISRKGKYIPGNVYNHTKEIFKKWQSKSFLGLDLSEDITNLTNYDVSEINMRCDIFIRALWHYM